MKLKGDKKRAVVLDYDKRGRCFFCGRRRYLSILRMEPRTTKLICPEDCRASVSHLYDYRFKYSENSVLKVKRIRKSKMTRKEFALWLEKKYKLLWVWFEQLQFGQKLGSREVNIWDAPYIIQAAEAHKAKTRKPAL